jgi:DNA repair exonuclease SbcCD ATPase subunit
MQGKRDQLIEQRDNAIIKRAKAEQDLGIYDKVQLLLQKTSDFARQQAKTRIEEIVTSALSVVFGRDYRFRLELEVRANRPEVDYWLESEGVITQLKPPDYDRGGGVADVISLALRLAIGELSNVKGPIWLDDCGKHISAEFAPNVAFFLKEYSQKFNRQMILITHNDALAEIGDISLAVSQSGGKSVVKVV